MHNVAVRRFTPTCVGNTSSSAQVTKALFGSPPRAWGIRQTFRSTHPNVRFTPTCVGNTSRDVSAAVRVHGSPPRAWGIPPLSTPLSNAAIGSPPRAWGIRAKSKKIIDLDRFTPTCVGNTFASVAQNQRIVRFTPTCVGNTDNQVTRCPCHFGSPPRAWGIQRRDASQPLLSPVHPHVRGEYAG